MSAFRFSLRLGNQNVEFSGELPQPEAPSREMVPVYLEIGETLLQASAEEAEREGRTPSCGAHCGACCRQLVPVSRSEGAYLREMVITMLEPDHRERVQQRIAAAREKLAANGMAAELAGLPAEGDRGKRQNTGLRYFFLGIACPFLEEESCSIHPWRPLACREYLVTSPSSRCSSPSAEGIEQLQPKVKPSAALIRLDQLADGSPGWLTMISALTTDQMEDERQVSRPEEELRSFLSLLLSAGRG